MKNNKKKKYTDRGLASLNQGVHFKERTMKLNSSCLLRNTILLKYDTKYADRGLVSLN